MCFPVGLGGIDDIDGTGTLWQPGHFQVLEFGPGSTLNIYIILDTWTEMHFLFLLFTDISQEKFSQPDESDKSSSQIICPIVLCCSVDGSCLLAYPLTNFGPVNVLSDARTRRYDSVICCRKCQKVHILLQQIAESYLLARALLSKLAWPLKSY